MLCTPRSLLALYSGLDYCRLLRTHHRTEICCRQLRSSNSYMWPHIMAAGLVIEQQENPRFEKLFKWKNTQPYPAIVDIVLESNTHQKWRNEWRRHSRLDFVMNLLFLLQWHQFQSNISKHITRRLFLNTLQIFHRIGRDDLSFCLTNAT